MRKYNITVEKHPNGHKSYYIDFGGKRRMISTPAVLLNRIHTQKPTPAGVYYMPGIEDAIGPADIELMYQVNWWASTMYTASNNFPTMAEFYRKWRRYFMSDVMTFTDMEGKQHDRVIICRIGDNASKVETWAVIEWPPR